MTRQGAGQTLWCLPYDTDSVFKTFLKIPFSTYLNHLISNESFPAYQAAIAKEIGDRSCWNQKCWLLISYFQFLNESFDISVWDGYINFIEDNHLRNIMGYFRLWIDTERLYLLNFLKLDSNQFQEDRIFMSLFRVLLFFNNLFTQYMNIDFDPVFLQNFMKTSITMIRKLSQVTTNQTCQIVEAIITLFKNLQKKQRILIQLTTLQILKKSATIKVSKQSQLIKDVEQRLQNNSHYKLSLDQQVRLNRIAKADFIEDISQPIRSLYDPAYKIQRDYQIQYYGTLQEHERRRMEGAMEKVQEYKKEVKGKPNPQSDIYRTIQSKGNNPYSIKNYQIYGEMIKINMDDKNKYEKEKVEEVASVDENDSSKVFYEEGFMKGVDEANGRMGRVTVNDINTTAKTKIKKGETFKHNDENTRVFNLKWHHDVTTRRTQSISDEEIKDYDNNLLFKSPLEEQLLTNRKNNLDKLKDIYETNSYTIALLERQADDIFPEQIISSQGADLFIKKNLQILDLNNFQLLNHNKFDFMRKVIGFMAAKKKIQKVISQKVVSELYPRKYCDVHQEAYDPQLQDDKIRYAMGRTDIKPKIYL